MSALTIWIMILVTIIVLSLMVFVIVDAIKYTIERIKVIKRGYE